MNDLPPGLLYLIQSSPRILSPPALTYGIARFVGANYGIYISTWWLVLAMVMSLPVALMCSVLREEVSIRLEASKRGAVLPPRFRDPYPGGTQGLVSGLRQFKKGYPGDGFDEICEELGSYTFNRRILFENRIITAEPEHIKAILATQFDDFEKGPEIRHLFYPLLGTGVFAADGELWKFHRSMTRPFFSRDRISHFDNFDRHAEDAIRQFKNRLHEGHPVDFQVRFFSFLSSVNAWLAVLNDILVAGLGFSVYARLGHGIPLRQRRWLALWWPSVSLLCNHRSLLFALGRPSFFAFRNCLH
ncbi:hypothetical protein M413DRAFT_123126 [Hebeloma cylindrosporum]|uniref:Cytochrome P450 n=1 Tax=Hebeloma cylindrosporum TaxID=76867 RepID=A0A0C3CEX2_HEBCY|nr:hypothetical protein M413DRAFT_123126 [Hebeloma cylindrosporum h7]